MCEKCQTAMTKLTEAFGAEDGDTLLWNATCFPMSGDTCLEQAEKLVEKGKKGMTAREIMAEVEAEMREWARETTPGEQ